MMEPVHFEAQLQENDRLHHGSMQNCGSVEFIMSLLLIIAFANYVFK